jgi:GNAT superfamily N-acetyltransferase
MNIEYLADHPVFIPELARLHHEQWGYLRPDKTVDERIERLESVCGRGGIPTVFVAIEDGALRGSAMLIASDMDARPDLTPWLAGVFVVEEFREHGYGTALVQRVEQEAASLGVPRLYLYTPSREGFYARIGWALDERCVYLGQEVAIMSKVPRLVGALGTSVG